MSPFIILYNTAAIIFFFLISLFFFSRKLSHKKKNLEDQNLNLTEFIKLFDEKIQFLSSNLLNVFYEKTEHHLKIKTEAINNTLKPFSEKIETFRNNLISLEKQRLEEGVFLKTQIEKLLESEKNLKNETNNLANILKCPGTRGHWGEIQLKRILEFSGMIPYCDFQEQYIIEENKRKPDVIIKLPGNKFIIIDAKAPFIDDYLQNSSLYNKASLVLKIKEHIKNLNSKNYWQSMCLSPDFVILFLPGESIFNDAISQEASLIDFANKKNIFLTSPTTLLAMLKTIAFSWRQDNLLQKMEHIGLWGKDLYSQLLNMSSHFAKVGKHLEQSVTAYNDTLKNFEKKVLSAAKKFENFNVTNKETQNKSPEEISLFPKASQE